MALWLVTVVSLFCFFRVLYLLEGRENPATRELVVGILLACPLFSLTATPLCWHGTGTGERLESPRRTASVKWRRAGVFCCLAGVGSGKREGVDPKKPAMQTREPNVTCVAGLTRSEAEDLLDWLENHGYAQCELTSPDGTSFTVRYATRA